MSPTVKDQETEIDLADLDLDQILSTITPQIKKCLDDNLSIDDIAKKFNVTAETVNLIAIKLGLN
jgi:hypothetical protein